MGQQQLLLIILAVIIIGISVAVAITMFQDNAVDQNRTAVIGDLGTLAAKARQYYAKPVSLGGGGNSFEGLLSNDATSLAILASTAFTNNANGTYTIKTAGTPTQVIFHGVGKVAIDATNFPEYDMTVTTHTQTSNKIK